MPVLENRRAREREKGNREERRRDLRSVAVERGELRKLGDKVTRETNRKKRYRERGEKIDRPSHLPPHTLLLPSPNPRTAPLPRKDLESNGEISREKRGTHLEREIQGTPREPKLPGQKMEQKLWMLREWRVTVSVERTGS